MAYNSFEELKQFRKKLYEYVKGGEMEGFFDQHTDFYPDPTHFIYELLQNAEDMEATEVTFQLCEDKLFFEHNGTKRDFTLQDIFSITNFGKSTKADDPTQIGKFGIGFKAVYNYTNTPEIHSGEFDVRIENVIVPNDDGVPKTAKKNFTQFIFPFDKPDKNVEEVVREIAEDGLKKLNETAILFLSNIKTISYTLPDGEKGWVSVQSDVSNIDFISSIKVKIPNLGEKITYWGKFTDSCALKRNQSDSEKNFPVSIAYRLKKIDGKDDKFELDKLPKGEVCLFFPAENENSGLHFHINAPFASTVARNVILKKGEGDKANEKLIEKLADLTAEYLHRLKKEKMLNFYAYSTLPAIQDFNESNKLYKIFAERVKQEFEKEEFFITETGEYCSIQNILTAEKNIKTILPTQYLNKLYNKSWFPAFNPIPNFIKQFKINKYTIENLISDLVINGSDFFDELFLEKAEQKDLEYFKNLYYQLAKCNNYITNLRTYSKNEALNEVKFLLCEDGMLYSKNDNLFFRTNYQPKHYIKNPLYVNIDLADTPYDNDIKQFLLNIGVKKMCEKADWTNDFSGKVPTNDLCSRIKEIIEEYKSGTIKIEEFEDSEIFLARNRNGEKYRVKAKDCCWSKALAFFFDKTEYTIRQEEYQFLGEDLPIFKEIFSKLGGKTKLKIVPTEDISPLDKYKLLDRSRERRNNCFKSTWNFDKFDWSKIDLIKQKNLREEAKLLWMTIQNCKENCLLGGVCIEFDYCLLQTSYTPNKSAPEQKCESIIVCFLKRTAWVPTVSGYYKRPCDLNEDDLIDEEYRKAYANPSGMLKEILQKPANDLVEELKHQGITNSNLLRFASLPPDEQAKLLDSNEQKTKSSKRSLTEALAVLNREQVGIEDNDDDYGDPRKLKNPDKRRIKLEKEFYDREPPVIHFKKVQFVLEKPNKEEKTFVKEEYHSHCQICGQADILTAKGKRYFEAINIFDTGKLNEEAKINLNLGWNTLCLCPNCAAKFKYSQLSMDGFIEQVENIDFNTVSDGYINISITLQNEPTNIRFTHKHLQVLQVAIRKIKSNEAKENDG